MISDPIVLFFIFFFNTYFLSLLLFLFSFKVKHLSIKMTSGAPILASAVAAALQSGYRPNSLIPNNSYQPQLMPMSTATTPYYPPLPTTAGYPPDYNYYSPNYYPPPPPPPMMYNNSTCCGVPDICCLALYVTIHFLLKEKGQRKKSHFLLITIIYNVFI